MAAKFWLISFTSALLVIPSLAGCDRSTAQEHLERARLYVADNDPRSAIIELKNALQKDPNLVDARLVLGETDLQFGDYLSALKELERALDLGADHALVMPPLLEAKLEEGRYQEVLGALDALEETPRLNVVRGRALLMANDLPQAAAAFRKALTVEPKLPVAYIGLAQIELASNDPQEAATLLARAVEADPRSRRAWLAQGDLSASQSDFDAARASFEQAGRLPGVDLLPQLGIVRVLILQGKLDEANGAVDQVIAKAPSAPMANYFKGLIAFQKEDYAASEKALRIVQVQAPDHPPTLLLLGTVKYRQGQYAEAQSQIGQFLAFDPDNLSARTLLAACRLATNDANGAIDALEPIAARLDDAQSLTLLGNAYLRAGTGDKATAYLQRAVELSPDKASLRTQLALSLIAGGETKNAIAQLQTAVTLDDKLIQSDVLLVLLQLKEGNYDQAMAAAKALADGNPKSPVGFNLLGAVHIAKKEPAAASAAFEQALVIDPAYSPAAQNLAKMAVASGDTAGARARLKALLDHNATDVTALLGLAQLAATDREWATAKDYLGRARIAHPDVVQPRIALSRMALLTNDPALAQEASSEVLALDPGNFDALALHAQSLVALGRSGSAEPDVNKMNSLAANPNANVRSLLSVAELQWQLGQFDRARANLLRAIEGDPNSNDARIALVRVEVQRHDAEAAGKQLGELRKRGADATQVKLLDADVRASTGDTAAAIAMYRELQRTGNRDATLKLATLLERGGHTTEAKQVVQDWVKAHPDDFGAELALASFVLNEGDRSAAVKQYQALDAKRADNPVVLNNLAWLYFETGNPKAIDAARRAATLAPGNAEIADTLGWILVQRDDSVAEGLTYLESAATARPKDASIQFHLASAYQRLKRTAEARRAVDRALELGEFPEQAEARALRDGLESRSKS